MRTVAISGAASGLGAATRAILEAQGDRVVGVDLRGSDVDADLATPEGRDTAIRHVVERAGGALDAAIVCAGLGPHVEDRSLIVAVNYFGALELLDGWRDALERGQAPAAVAIGSNSTTLDPNPDADLVAACLRGDEAEARRIAAGLPGHRVYSSSKAAVQRAIRHRAPAWGAHGVRLNAVAPGAFTSPLLQADLDDPTFGPAIRALPIPLAHIADTEEVADVVAWLCSSGARYVHGAVLFVDGGTDAVVRPDAF